MIPIERNLRKMVSAAVRSAAKAEKQLQAAREKRDTLARQTRNAQRRAANAQTAKSQKEYTRLLQQLEQARGVVKSRATVATEQRRAQKAAEKRLTAWEKTETNPYTGERYTHIFETAKPGLSDIGNMIANQNSLTYREQRDRMREMKQKIARRIRSIRDVGKQYGDFVPESDAVTEYEQGIKNLSPSDTDNFVTIALFYNKLFNSAEFESGTMKDYRALIEGTNNFTNDLTESGYTEKDVKNFYRVMNLIKKYFPDYYDDSETRKQVKLRLDSGMSWKEIFNQMQTWWNSEQEQLDREKSQKNIARRKQEQEQARAARFKQKQREIMEKAKKKRGTQK